MSVYKIILLYYNSLTSKIKLFTCLVILLIFLSALLETIASILIVPYIMIISNNYSNSNVAFFTKLNEIFLKNNKSDMIFYYSIVLLFVFAAKSFFTFFVQRLQFNFIYNLLLKSSLERFSKFLEMEYEKSKTLHSSLIIRNIATDTQNFHLNFLIPFFTVTSEVAIFILMLMVLFLTYPLPTITVLIVLGVSSFSYTRFVRKKTRLFGIIEQVEGARKISIINDIVKLFREIKLYESKEYFLRKYQNSEKMYIEASRYSMVLNQTPRIFIEFTTFSIMFIGVIFMIYLDYNLNNFLPILSIFAIVAVRLLPSMNRIVQSFTRMNYYKSSYNSIFEDSSIEDLVPINSDIKIFDSWKFIEIRDLSFSYQNSGKVAFHQLNFNIERNKILCLTGASGSGKSTFAEVLLGLLMPSTGSIFLNGIDIRTCMKEWRNKVAYIPQEIHLMDTSIRENLLFGLDKDNISDDLLWNTLNNVQLSEFLHSNCIDLNYIVGENGGKFSGGQKQRFAIARALIRGAEIIIMDESTSALDKETEQSIIDFIRVASGSTTFIIIAHNILTIKSADYVLDFNSTIYT